ncbi:LTA synthase family protein [Vagococcus elongatus]
MSERPIFMILLSIIVSSLYFFFLYKVFNEKKKSVLLSTVFLNATISLGFYLMFIGDLSFSQWGKIFLVPDIKMLMISLITGFFFFSSLFIFCYFKDKNLVYHRQKNITVEKRTQVSRIIMKTVSLLFVFAGFLFFFSCRWVIDYFGEVDIEQVLFTLTQSVTESGTQQIESFVFNPLLTSLIISFSIWLCLNFFIEFTFPFTEKLKIEKFGFWKYLSLSLSALLLIVNLYSGLSFFGIDDVKAALFVQGKIYESFYVPGEDVPIELPENKRNLIYIFAESMETTYVSKELGGAMDENLLPNLSALAQENISFSNTNLLGGALSAPGTGFTVAAMTAQTSGTPMRASAEKNQSWSAGGDLGNAYGQEVNDFLPGVYSLGEILDEHGYQQELLIGSSASFGGRDKYFQQHGNYTISDYQTALDEGWIPEGYKIWWGYEDEKLFQFAKSRLDELSSSGEPFNFTLLTADTHFEDGLMTENTPVVFDDQYSNVIHWSDQMIYDFVEYVKTQPYYENTTIIICGDHLSMDQDFFENISKDYDRTVFNVIINSPVSPQKTNHRLFSTMDFFPTTLAALGANIEGERLGLGTNLFSEKETLMEELGYETFYQELQKKSEYYTNVILNGHSPETFSSSE